MNYRLATASDLDLLATWNHEMIRDEGHRNQMTEAELRARMEEWIGGEYEAVIFESDFTPVAYALCRREGTAVHIRHLFVDRARRGAGLGKEAVRLLFSEVYPDAERLYAEVLVDNASGRGFWKAAGFRDYAIAVEQLRR